MVTKRINQMKASELLKISDRHFRRLWRVYKKDGAEGLISKKRGKSSNNRLPDELYHKAVDLIKKHYLGFGSTLAKKHLYESHKVKVSTETLRQWMIKAEVWSKKKRKKLLFLNGEQYINPFREFCEEQNIPVFFSHMTGK